LGNGNCSIVTDICAHIFQGFDEPTVLSWYLGVVESMWTRSLKAKFPA
jgi:hypothetical protein